MNKTICNVCGKTIIDHDVVIINHNYGYWSKYDLDRLQATFCNECFDKLTDELVERCKLNPITEYEPPIEEYGFKVLFVHNEVIPMV